MEALKIHKNPISILFFILSAAVFLVAQGTDPENIRFLAFDSAELPHGWYGILTYGIVHVEWNHIIVNMGLLLWIGIWVERLIGSKKYFFMIILGILAGGFTLYIRETAGIGFSAAAAAILFYYHFAFPFKKELPFDLPNFLFPTAALFVTIGSILFGWFPSAGHYPHLAGALVGMIFLALFRKQHRSIED